MSTLDPYLIKKYFKNQKPPNIKDLQSKGLKFTDPYFPPNANCLIGIDPSGNLIDEENSEEGMEDLEQVFPGCSRGKGALVFKRISELKGNWKVFTDKIEMDDILQGGLGDCYFLTSMAALSNYPYLIKEKFRTTKYNDIGYYEVILFIDGEWQIVFIDDYFAVNSKNKDSFAFAKPNNYELWAIILEKAWAKVNGGYSLIQGGWIREGFQVLTGFPSFVINHNKIKPRDLFEKLVAESKEKTLMGCGSQGDTDRDTVQGIVQRHAFALTEAKSYNEVDLIKVRNPWGMTEWEGDWSDNSPLWTPELRSYFGCEVKDDGIFWIDYINFSKHFMNTDISYILYGSIIKSINIEQPKLLKSPLVFNIHLEQPGKFGVNLIFPYWRFNRERLGNEYPAHIVLAQYNKAKEIQSLFSQGASGEAIALVKDLPEGNYLLWVYFDYEHGGSKKDLKYTLRLSSLSNFTVEFMGQDDNFKIVEYVICDYNKRFNGGYKHSAEYYIGTDAKLSKEGFLNHLIYNKTQNKKLLLTIDSKTTNFTFLNMTPVSKIEVPPMGGACLIAVNNQDAYSYSCNYNDIYLNPCKNNVSLPDNSKILGFMTSNVNEENTETRGLVINAYKYVGKDQLQNLPVFTGIQQAEEEAKKKREEEEAKKKIEEERRRQEEEVKRKQQEELQAQLQKEEAERQRKIYEELEKMRQIEEQKRKDEEEKERMRLEEIEKQRFQKVSYSSIRDEYSDEMIDLNKYCPECSPYNNIKRDWVIIKLDNGQYIGEVKSGTEILHGRGMMFWNNNDFINYSYFCEGLADNLSVIKKRGSTDWTFYGAMKNGKKNGKGTFVSKTDPETGIRTEYFVGNFVDDYMEGEGTMYFGNDESWNGNFTKNKKNGVGLYYSGEKQNSTVQKYENDVFVRELSISRDELKNLQNQDNFFEALENYYNQTIENEEFSKSLDTLPEEDPEFKQKRQYYQIVEKLKEEEPFAMQAYFLIHDQNKKEDPANQYNLSKLDLGKGKKYIGQVINKRQNGKGVYIDGDTLYAGYWNNGTPNSFFSIYKNGHLEYKGIFNNWVKDIRGTMYENGHPVYKGEIKSGKITGFGIKYMKKSGELFQGQFEDGKMINEGRYYSHDCLLYQEVSTINGEINQEDLINKPYLKTLEREGDELFDEIFKQNEEVIEQLSKIRPKIETKKTELKWGTQETKDGDFYIGQLKGDEPYGVGAIIYAEDNQFGYYIGYVKQGLPHNQGTLYTKSWEIIYEGGFEYGKKSGLGTEYIGEETFMGYFCDGIRNGPGVSVNADVIFEGTYVNDKKQGKGYLIDLQYHTIVPVTCLQGNIEKEGEKEKLRVKTNSQRKEQLAKLPTKYQKFIDMISTLELDPVEEMYLDMICKEEEGSTYVGECNHAGMKHGRGVLIDHFYQTYTVGQFRYDQKTGKGAVYRLEDDLILYEGFFNNGKPLGDGKYYFYEPTYHRIEGSFNELGDGEGKEIYEDGSYWDGDFFAWTKNAIGNLYSANNEELGDKIYTLDKAEDNIIKG